MPTLLSCTTSVMTITCVRFYKMIPKLTLIIFFISVFLVAIYLISESPSDFSMDTTLPSIFNNSKLNSRSKRFLIFPGGGVLKLVLGYSQPLNLLDRHPYRQLSLSYSIHLQFTPPTRPVYWWTYFTNSPAWSHARKYINPGRPKKVLDEKTKDRSGSFVERHYRQPAIVYDMSRFTVYKAIEAIFTSKGLPGERCLLRTICEISQRPLCENSAIHGIINAIFSPSVVNIDRKYLHAKHVGVHGMDCEKIYWSCNEGMKWLKQMSHYV